MSNSLRLHELQQTSLPCPSLSLWNCSNSCPLNQQCIPAVSSVVAPFSSLPSIFPRIRIFSHESALHIRWPKYWSFSFRIRPSNEYSRLIAFRIDWFDLLAVQGTLNSLLQYDILKASVVGCSAFLMVQLSYLYMIIQTKNMCVTHPVSYIVPRKNWQNWVPSSASP